MTSGTTLGHRHSWTLEERLIIGFFGLVPMLLIAWMLRDGMTESAKDTVVSGGLPVLAVCWGLAAFLFRLGSRRKTRSQIEANLEGSQFSFKGGRFNRSKGSLADNERVATRRAGPEHALVFSRRSEDGTPDPEVVVPLRLVRQNAPNHDTLVAAIKENALREGMDITDDARRVIAQL